MSNPLPWPEIKHLPDYYRSLLEAYIRFEEDPDCDDPTVRKPISKERLYELLFDIKWFANIKYDGTNLAVSRSRKIYGRRQHVPGPTYQKCDVTFLVDTSIEPVSVDVLGKFTDKVSKFFVYGELVINNKYDYTAKDIFGKWLAFGICLEIPQVEDGIEIHEFLEKEGFRLNSIPRVLPGQATKITILLNDKLREVLQKHNIPTGDTLFANGNLIDLICDCRDWMCDGNGEGLVCVSNEFQKKWKIGMEHQPSIFENLKEILEKASTYDLDPRIIQAGKILFEVKESSKLMGENVKKKPGPKQKKVVPLLFDPQDMKAAIESALTKYDSLDYYFKENKMKDICSLVYTEVKDDLMPTLAEDAIQQDAIKEINNSVRKYVGIRYGMWKGHKVE